jgi:hypothetical protein
MAWAVTLLVKDCGTMAPLSGALVTDGVGGGHTDSYGQFIAVIDDAYTGYVVQVSKSGYNARNFTFARSQEGTTQNTCLTVYVAPPNNGNSGGLSCFIVTAASGSEQSPEVTGMRALRDQVTARAPLAGRLIDAIYNEYWQFSPAVADQIRDSGTARMTVMALVVRPLFAWFELAGQLALAPDDADAVKRAERALASACPRYFGPSRVAGYLRQLSEGGALPESMPALVAQLAPQLQQAMALPLVRWAILQPLQLAWQGAADGGVMRDEVARWLASAPIETLSAPQAADAPAELASLASLLSFDRAAGNALGQRLAQAWPDHAAALQAAGLG